MKTSQQWWNEVKASPELLKNWLQDQEHGELTAYQRIKEITKRSDIGLGPKNVLKIIAEQERTHHHWIQVLLMTRGIETVKKDSSRYWNETLNNIDLRTTPLTELAAIGAHAEGMRLERIKVIAADEESPADIRAVFARILVDEDFHERAFTGMTNAETLALKKNNHEAGMNALGLTL